MSTQYTRRRVLRNVVAGAAATGIAGKALADPPDRKIVGLTADASPGLAKQAADEVHHELDFGDIGKAVVGKFPATALDGLRNHSQVRYVEDDQRAYALQTLPWGIDRVDADVVHANGETGNGANIAIIDTGIDANHDDLNVSGGEDFTGTGSWDDDNGHGTHCAGTANGLDNDIGVVGVSTEANLYAVKVLDSGGSGTFGDIAAGIEWAADNGMDVASMSLGGSSGTTSLQDAVQYAVNNGTFVVAAAGNDYGGAVGYPAAYSEVMAVSSTDSNDNLSTFSSTGPEVEIAAPGSDIYSTYPTNSYNTLSGTSMACPHVAGAAGLLMANGLSNSETRQQLKDSAEDLGLASNEQGAGLLDVEAAINGDDGGGGGGGDNAPTVDQLSVNNRSNGGWARFNVDWAVSDADGDLASVDLTLEQNGTADSASNSVSGSSASGSDQLQDKKGSGSYTITVTVTDGAGNTASQSTTVSA